MVGGVNNHWFICILWYYTLTFEANKKNGYTFAKYRYSYYLGPLWPKM